MGSKIEKNESLVKIESFLQELLFEDNNLFKNLEKVIKQINMLNFEIVYKLNQYICLDLTTLEVKTIFLSDLDSMKYCSTLYNPDCNLEFELTIQNLIFKLIKSIIKDPSIKKFFI